MGELSTLSGSTVMWVQERWSCPPPEQHGGPRGMDSGQLASPLIGFVQKNWPYLSLAAALRKADPESLWGNTHRADPGSMQTGEPALILVGFDIWMTLSHPLPEQSQRGESGRAGPAHCQLPQARELALPLTRAKQKSWPWWCGCRRAGGMTNSATT